MLGLACPRYFCPSLGVHQGYGVGASSHFVHPELDFETIFAPGVGVSDNVPTPFPVLTCQNSIVYN